MSGNERGLEVVGVDLIDHGTEGPTDLITIEVLDGGELGEVRLDTDGLEHEFSVGALEAKVPEENSSCDHPVVRHRLVIGQSAEHRRRILQLVSGKVRCHPEERGHVVH
jgi:hypothetical protein